MKKKCMNWRFFSLILSFFLLTIIGCASIIVNVPPKPMIPAIVIEPLEPLPLFFKPPQVHNYKYVTADGKKNQSKDNVTVSVDHIINKIEDGKLTITIEGPDSTHYKYQLFPMILVISLTNNTDHIITLRRTIIRIEDENKNDYPLINNQSENKMRLISEIRNAFDDYRNKINNQLQSEENAFRSFEEMNINQFHDVVFNNYTVKYDSMKEIINNHFKLNPNGEIETEGYYYYSRNNFSKYAAQNLLLYPMEPNKIYQSGIAEIQNQLAERYRTLRNLRGDYNILNELESLKQKAIKQIENIPEIENLITNGDYLPISILPERTEKIFVPFNKRSEEEVLKNLIVGIYDLPTQTNAAGDPIKRANFIFHLKAVEE